jgi:PII-like signaling protein
LRGAFKGQDVYAAAPSVPSEGEEGAKRRGNGYSDIMEMKTEMKTAVQVTAYVNESDQWLEILRMLRSEGVAGATAFHAVAGFTGRNSVHTSSLVEAGGNLPVVIVFVDYDEHVTRVLPKLKKLVPDRLIVRENVVIEQGSLD